MDAELDLSNIYTDFSMIEKHYVPQKSDGTCHPSCAFNSQ